MSIVKVAVVGSRDIKDKEFVYQQLNFYLSRLMRDREVVIVSGDQVKGVDGYAKAYAKDKGLGYIGFPPQYDKFPPKQAPLERNTQIVENSDYLIAIQKDKSRGTQDSINKAIDRGLPIKIIVYETHQKTIK